MATYNVSTVFRGIDKMSPVLGKIGSRASRVGDIMKGNLIASGIQKGIGLLGRGIGTVADEFVQFDDAIVSASAKFKNLTQTQFKELKKEARDVGANTKFSAAEAAQGLDFLAMAGFNASQSMALLAPNAKLATVANVDMARSTDIASDSIGAFGLMAKDTATLQANFIRMNDSMAETMRKSNTGIEDMFESIKKGAPAFTAAGQRMNTFNSLVGILASNSLKGSESGTALRNIMLRLSKPTGEAEKVLNDLNIKTQDSQGNFRDIVSILGDFETGLKGMGTAQKTAALSTVFGARAVTAVNLLLQEGTTKINAFRDGLDNSAGAADRMAKIMSGSLGNKLRELRSGLIEIGFKFIDAFQKDGRGGLDALIQKVREFDIQPIIEAVRVAISVFKFLWPTLKIAIPILTALAAAQWALNIAMSANPIGLIIIGISALIAGGIKLYQNWDKVKSVFSTIGGVLVKVFRKIGWAIFNYFTLPLRGALMLLSKIPGIGKFADMGLTKLNNISNAIEGTAEAPNKAKEDGRRAIGGEGTVTVKAEKGTEVTGIDNGISGVNLAMAGVN